jgi:predicted DNA-binding transcriptional regulator AlpA
MPVKHNPFESLPDVGGTRVRAVARMCGVVPATYYNWVKRGLMPAPMKIGPNSSIVPNRALKEAGAKLVKESA